MTDAPDTGAVVAGTASYFNREANPDLDDCPCRGIPDGMHIPPCPHNDTPHAEQCEHCENEAVHVLGVCQICGYRKEEKE